MFELSHSAAIDTATAGHFDPLAARSIDRPLRIGIDGRMLGARDRGVSRYVWNMSKVLATALPNEQFYVYSSCPLTLPVHASNWILRTEPRFRTNKLALWLKFRAGALCRADDLDVFWGAYHFLPILPKRVRSVITVYDLAYKMFPQYVPVNERLMLRLFFRRDLARANAIIAVSRGTASRLRHFTGLAATRVARPAISEHFTPRDNAEIRRCLDQYSISAPYILSVAAREPRKNLAPLVNAFVDLKRSGLLRYHRLVLAGGHSPIPDAKLAHALMRAQPGDVTMLGFVADEDLPALYSGAAMFALPSLYEGFGIAAMEARACGTPVVTTDIPELREAGGDDAIYVPPTEAGLRAGIQRALASPPRRRVRPRLWSWQDSARILADALTG